MRDSPALTAREKTKNVPKFSENASAEPGFAQKLMS